MLQNGKLIPLSKQNINVFGQTRTGKSWTVHKTLLASPSGVLFFNVQQDDKFKKGFICADMKDDSDDIFGVLEKGGHICYMPSDNPDIMQREHEILVGEVYKKKRSEHIYFVTDEAHLMNPKVLTRLSTTCLSWGVTSLTITQRAAKMDYTTITQSPQRVFFDLDTMDQEYFRTKKFPIDAIIERIRSGGENFGRKDWESPYLGNYIVYEMDNIQGAFRA